MPQPPPIFFGGMRSGDALRALELSDALHRTVPDPDPMGHQSALQDRQTKLRRRLAARKRAREQARKKAGEQAREQAAGGQGAEAV